MLVIRGEPGIGKTALLHDVVERATGFRVAQIAGVESEMEFAYAGLHQVCLGMLDRLDVLPEPQQAALSVALGLASGAPPDRFLVGLATLGLMSAVAGEQPLLYVVDDLQWLDDASARVLGFVARRLLAEPVALVFGVREPSDERQLAGLPGAAAAAGSTRPTPARCSRRSSRARSTSASVTGSSPRRTATRSPCSSCRAR